MKQLALALTLLLLSVGISAQALAEDLFMKRSDQAFPETMVNLQDSIKQHGYVVTRVQRVDIGMQAMGYKTDKYRVVFFAKLDELRALSDKHPDIVPYLPQKISLFAEGEQTLVVASNPGILKSLYPNRGLDPLFDRWEADLRAIFKDMQ